MTSLDWFTADLVVFGLLLAGGYTAWLNRSVDRDAVREKPEMERRS